METLSAKVPEDLANRIDEYADTHGLNTSQAWRQLARAGLDQEENPHSISLPTLLLWFGSVAVAAQYATATGMLGPAGLVSFAAGILLLNDRIRDRFNSLRSGFTDGEAPSDDTDDTENDAAAPVAES